ncbi:hypothetical protein NKG94_14895 [Micromonospora sp. M12]
MRLAALASRHDLRLTWLRRRSHPLSPGRAGARRGGPVAADDEVSTLAYTARRVRRHLRWARTEGIGRLIEEDRLNPVDRIGTALAKRRWRRRSGRAPARRCRSTSSVCNAPARTCWCGVWTPLPRSRSATRTTAPSSTASTSARTRC